MSKTIVHVAVGFVKANDDYGVVGTWPLTPICGKPEHINEEYYKGHYSLEGNVEPCVECFSHPDMPLILLGAL